MYDKAIVTILKPFDGFLEGQRVEIDVLEDGTPIDAIWRRRFKDAKADNCCSYTPAKQKRGKVDAK